jgi:hypothetical protein
MRNIATNITHLIKECFYVELIELPISEMNYLLIQLDVISDLISTEIYLDEDISDVFKEYCNFESSYNTNCFTKLYLNTLIDSKLQVIKNESISLQEYETTTNLRNFITKFKTIY